MDGCGDGAILSNVSSFLLCVSSAASVEFADRRAIFRALTVVHSTSSLLSDQGMKFFVKIGDVLQCAAGPRLF